MPILRKVDLLDEDYNVIDTTYVNSGMSEAEIHQLLKDEYDNWEYIKIYEI